MPAGNADPGLVRHQPPISDANRRTPRHVLAGGDRQASTTGQHPTWRPRPPGPRPAAAARRPAPVASRAAQRPVTRLQQGAHRRPSSPGADAGGRGRAGRRNGRRRLQTGDDLPQSDEPSRSGSFHRRRRLQRSLLGLASPRIPRRSAAWPSSCPPARGSGDVTTPFSRGLDDARPAPRSRHLPDHHDPFVRVASNAASASMCVVPITGSPRSRWPRRSPRPALVHHLYFSVPDLPDQPERPAGGDVRRICGVSTCRKISPGRSGRSAASSRSSARTGRSPRFVHRTPSVIPGGTDLRLTGLVHRALGDLAGEKITDTSAPVGPRPRHRAEDRHRCPPSKSTLCRPLPGVTPPTMLVRGEHPLGVLRPRNRHPWTMTGSAR